MEWLLLWPCSTLVIGIFGRLRRWDFSEEGIPISGHKPIQQIAERLNQWKTQENCESSSTLKAR